MDRVEEETLLKAKGSIDALSYMLIGNMAAELAALAELKRMIQEIQMAQMISEQ